MLTKTFWKKYFKEYDLLNLLLPYQETLKLIAVRLKVQRGDKILDAGSGTGNLSLLLEKLGADVVGLDSSSAGLDIHKQKSMTAKLLEHDLTKPLPFANGYFDKICSNNTLYTIPPILRRKVISELHRILRGGGLLVVSNLQVSFSPLRIYKSHLLESSRTKGILKTLMTACRLLAPTIKIFYYNQLIKRENISGEYAFFRAGEQKELLLNAGFKTVSDDEITYAGQAVLNVAIKE